MSLIQEIIEYINTGNNQQQVINAIEKLEQAEKSALLNEFLQSFITNSTDHSPSRTTSTASGVATSLTSALQADNTQAHERYKRISEMHHQLLFDKKLRLSCNGIERCSESSNSNAEFMSRASNQTKIDYQKLLDAFDETQDDSINQRGVVKEHNIHYRISLGMKKEMEDGLGAGAFKNPGIQDLDDFRKLLLETERQRAQSCTYVNNGTTIAVGMLVPWRNTIVCAGIGAGDSSVLLVYREKNQKNFEVERLTPMHNPGEPEEKSWIEKAGGSVINYRNRNLLNFAIAVSRSYGDGKVASQLNSDVSQYHQAQITLRPLPASAEEAYMVVCCDAITDALWNDIDIAHGIGLATQFENMADFIGFITAHNHYWDNSSVAVMPIPNTLDEIRYAQVNDGHGGTGASNDLTASFHETYSAALAKHYSQPDIANSKPSVCITPADFSQMFNWQSPYGTDVDEYKKLRWKKHALIRVHAAEDEVADEQVAVTQLNH